MSIKINTHAHLLPEPEAIPRFMADKEIFWLDPDRRFMYQKDWKRPVTDASFFLDGKLAWMDRAKVDHAVILNLSQLFCNGLREPTLRKVVQFQNDFNASVQARYPSKFTAGFVVNPVYPDTAVREIRRCVEELGLQVLCLPAHYLAQDGTWRCTFESDNGALLEAANDYGLAVQVHPYDADKMVKLANTAWRFHLVWMMAQCADAYHFYTLNGCAFRYPKMRVCFAHGAQYAQVSLGRRQRGFDGRPDLFSGMQSPAQSIGHENIFFDSLVHDIDSFELMIRKQGSGQVLAGLDDPYPLGEVFDAKAALYPGKLLDDAVRAAVISEDDRHGIWFDNAIRWLVGDDAFKKSQLLERLM